MDATSRRSQQQRRGVALERLLRTFYQKAGNENGDGGVHPPVAEM